ncbi:hypothetical protein EBU99_09225 [bacterium]|nr:hypothetical protein [bacterium]
MVKLLIWFAILYGNLVALVGLAVISVWWTKQSSGQQFCQAVGLQLTGCRSALLIADIAVMGSATLLSFRRLSLERRGFEGGKSSKNHSNSGHG